MQNCTNPAAISRKFPDGRRWYRKLCGTHYRHTQGVRSSTGANYFAFRKRFPNTACSSCGKLSDKKRPNHRHRIVPGDGYIEGNVVILCPSCHLILHRLAA